MRKTFGKDKDFRKALIKNLIRNLTTHRKIKTTLTRGKQLKMVVPKMTGGVVRLVRLSERRGDGVTQVIVTFEPKVKPTTIQHGNKSNKKAGDKKKVASR